jgi:hypothetical protein
MSYAGILGGAMDESQVADDFERYFPVEQNTL